MEIYQSDFGGTAVSAIFAIFGMLSILVMIFGGGIEAGILAIFCILVAILFDQKPVPTVVIPGPGDKR
jgi:hypothetical protein